MRNLNRVDRLLSLPVTRIWVFTAISACVGFSLNVDTSPAARAEPSQVTRMGEPPVDFRPTGIPDYAKITGAIENAELPTTLAAVLWKVVSQKADPNGDPVPVGLSDAVVAQGILYFGDDRGNLVAFNIETQTELWSHEHGSRISMTPSVDRDFVYFGSEKGVTALRRDSGKVAWNYSMEHGAGETTPLPVGEYLYTSGYDGNSYRLKRETGEVVWQHDFGEDAPADRPGFDGARARFQNIIARPNGAACDGRLFLQSIFDQSRVIALDCETGKRCWTFQAGGWISPSPTIADGRVYVASQDEHLYCLDLATGNLLWKFKTESWLASRVAAAGGRVYLPCHKARIHQLAADSGQLIRTFQSLDKADQSGLVYSFPIVAGQTVFFACGNGLFFAFDIETGTLRWKIRPSEGSELFSNPATDGRRIFVRARPTLNKSGESSILAIGLEP